MKATLLLVLSFLATVSLAQQFQLKTDDGALSGPFEVRDGVVVAVGTSNATITNVVTHKDEVLNRMAKIRIPEADFRTASIRDVISFLSHQSVEFDHEHRGVNIVLELSARGDDSQYTAPDPFDDEGSLPPHADSLITFSAHDVSLLEILKIIVEVSGLKFWIREGVVVVSPIHAPEGDLLVRRYGFAESAFHRLHTLRYSGHDSHCFGSVDDPDDDLKRSFATLGVSWPTGSSVSFSRGLGKLIVKNTVENLDLLEHLIDALDLDPYQLELSGQFVAFTAADIAKLEVKGLSASSLLELWEQGGGELLASPRVITQTGQQATVRAVTECIYPTAFLVAQSGGTNTNTVSISSVVEPSDFKTREVGAILEIMPEVSPEGRMINLTISLEHVEDPVWKDFGGPYVDANGNEQEAHMQQPFFHTCTSRTTVLVKNGARVLAGGGMPMRDGKRILYVFISVKKVGTDGEHIEDATLPY
jgi:hypothetical protein